MNKKRTTFLLNAPYTLWAGIFIIVPIFIVVFYAFTDANGAFSLSNIKELKLYIPTFGISILYSLIATVITLIIGYPFAYAMTKTRASTQKMQMMLIMLPMWMNLLIRTYSWVTILEREGLINDFLGILGLDPVKMIGTPAAVILGMVYNYLPYMILPIYTVLSKIDNSLVEAAEDLGCSAFEKMRRLIVPMSIPGVISGIAMVFVPSVSTFYISQKLGDGQIILIGDTIERQMKTIPDFNVGAAISLVLMIMILISMTIMNKFSDSSDGGIVV